MDENVLIVYCNPSTLKAHALVPMEEYKLLTEDADKWRLCQQAMREGLARMGFQECTADWFKAQARDAEKWRKATANPNMGCCGTFLTGPEFEQKCADEELGRLVREMPECHHLGRRLFGWQVIHSEAVSPTQHATPEEALREALEDG